MNAIERARPLLGTVVSIRISGHAPMIAQPALDAAFDAVALIERLMSFQQPSSELSRLNRDAHRGPVQVHPHTWRVLHWSQRLAAQSLGVFDVSRAHRDGAASGDWRDLQLLPDHWVRYRRPLRLDLSGIAKGYAVDIAINVLRTHGVRRALVNAGGDLRLVGGREPVLLRTQSPSSLAAVVDLSDGALATSDGPAGITASVAARRCLLADALTKTLMAAPEAARPLLSRYGARGWLHRPDSGWQRVH